MVRDKYAVTTGGTPASDSGWEKLRQSDRPSPDSSRDDGWAAPQVAEALDVAGHRVCSALPGRGWRGPCGTGAIPTGTGSWMTGARRTWSLWPRSPAPEGHDAGPCACWLGRWWSWGWPCPTRECVSGSKKRSQAVAEEGMVHPQGEPEFVANMEDVLDLYDEPYDSRRPVSRRGHLCRPGPEFRCGRTTSTGYGGLASRGGDPAAHDGGPPIRRWPGASKLTRRPPWCGWSWTT